MIRLLLIIIMELVHVRIMIKLALLWQLLIKLNRLNLFIFAIRQV
jgi:hypothetical protein